MVFHESVWKSTNLNVYNRRNYTLGGTVIPWRTAGKHAHPFPFFCIYPPVNQQASEQIFPSDLKYCLPGYSPQRDNEKKHLLTYFEVGFFFQATIWRTRRDGDRKRCHLSAWTPRGTRALVAERAPCVQPVSSEGGGTGRLGESFPRSGPPGLVGRKSRGFFTVASGLSPANSGKGRILGVTQASGLLRCLSFHS